MPGRAGVTHCGSWTRNVWSHIYTTKVVCTLLPTHRGQHHSSWAGVSWPKKEKAPRG